MGEKSTIELEEEGMAILLQYLKNQSRHVEPSDRKSFDLIVDGEYAELKVSNQSFFALTGPQYKGLKDGLLQCVFVVEGGSVIEYSRDELLAVQPKHYETYEWSKSALRKFANKQD